MKTKRKRAEPAQELPPPMPRPEPYVDPPTVDVHRLLRAGLELSLPISGVAITEVIASGKVVGAALVFSAPPSNAQYQTLFQLLKGQFSQTRFGGREYEVGFQTIINGKPTYWSDDGANPDSEPMWCLSSYWPASRRWRSRWLTEEEVIVLKANPWPCWPCWP